MNIFKQAINDIATKSSAFVKGNPNWINGFLGVGSGYKDNYIDDDNVFINEGYANNGDVYSIIKKITMTAGMIPFKLYEKTPKGDVEITSGGLYDLLQNPNDDQTLGEFREEAIGNILNTGDRFIHGVLSMGSDLIGEFKILPSNVTEVVVDTTNLKVVGYRNNRNYGQNVYTKDEIYHGKYYNPTIQGIESFRGLSPLQAGYRNLEASNELITAEASVYKNKGVSGILSSGSEGVMMTPTEAKQLQEKINNKLGGANKVNGVATTSANVNYTSIGMSPSDMQLIKSGYVKLQGLCRLFGVSSQLFGDPSSSTYNNVQELNKKLYTDACIPNNEMLITELNRWLVPAWSKLERKDYVIKQDLKNIEALQINQKEEAEKNKIVADTITSVLSAPISNESKKVTLAYAGGVDPETTESLLPTPVEGTGSTENTGGNVQVQSLNGAQVTSMVAIVQGVGDGSIPKVSAINILVVSYGMTEPEATAIISPIQVKPTSNEG